MFLVLTCFTFNVSHRFVLCILLVGFALKHCFRYCTSQGNSWFMTYHTNMPEGAELFIPPFPTSPNGNIPTLWTNKSHSTKPRWNKTSSTLRPCCQAATHPVLGQWPLSCCTRWSFLVVCWDQLRRKIGRAFYSGEAKLRSMLQLPGVPSVGWEVRCLQHRELWVFWRWKMTAVAVRHRLVNQWEFSACSILVPIWQGTEERQKYLCH